MKLNEVLGTLVTVTIIGVGVTWIYARVRDSDNLEKSLDAMRLRIPNMTAETAASRAQS